MSQVKIKDAVVFVTGANRGIGRALVTKALELGAKKVYAGSRKLENLGDLANQENVVGVELEVTNESQIKAAANAAADTTILINNAGILNMATVLTAPDLNIARSEMEVNYFALINMARAFQPILIKNKGALLNVSSCAGWVNFPVIGTYSATKAAVLSLTQALRGELAPQDVFVAAIYPGPIDTDMTDGLEMEKASPEHVAENVYAGIEKGDEDIFPDPFAKDFIKAYHADWKGLERQNAAMLQGAEA